MDTRLVRLAAACLVVAAQALVTAQNTGTADTLQAGIAQVRTGNFVAAIATLNDAVTRATLEETGLVARAYIYKAEAHLGLGEPDYARTALVLALELEPAIPTGPLNLSATVTTFIDELRNTWASNPEAVAQSAETSGRYREAFDAYLRAYQSLPVPAPAADEQRLRERIITVVRRLDSKPQVAQEAMAHFAKAQQIADAEKVLGSASAASSEAIAMELRRAIRLAPWWADPAFKLAVVLQSIQRIDEAATNLHLYRLADPEGYAAIAAGSSAPAAASAAAVNVPDSEPPAAIAAAQASVYVYWPRQTMRGGTQKVLCDGIHIADLEDRHFVVLNAAPGVHTIKVQGREFPLSMEAGQTYYLRAYIGGYPARRMARQVPAAEATVELNDKGMDPNPRQKTFTSECTPQVRKTKG